MIIIKKYRDSDAEELYREYLSYQKGDKKALDRVFVQNQDVQNQEDADRSRLIDKYYSRIDGKFMDELMDGVLDAEFIKADISDEQEKYNNNVNVKFRFSCLNNMLSNAKWEYSQKSINTGYVDGEYKNGGHKKYYEGEYDVSDLNEMMFEIVIKIFRGELTSKKPIIDAATLLGNIKYHLTKQINELNKTIYKNVPEVKAYVYSDENEEETYKSYFDEVSNKEWLESEGSIARLIVYADCLKWIKNNDIHKLFKKDATDLHTIIVAICEYKGMFKSKNKEGLTKEKYENLKKYISQNKGVCILENNISADLKLIEQSLLDFLMYSLNYEIAKSNTDKEVRRELKELYPKKYFKLFGRESMDIHDLCKSYLKMSSKYDAFISRSKLRAYDDDLISKLISKLKKYRHTFISGLRAHEDTIIPILESEKGAKKYDMINLMCGTEKLEEIIETDTHTIMINIAETLISYYQGRETDYVNNFLEQYSIVDKFTSGRYKIWQADFNKKNQTYVKLKWYSNENIKNPTRIKVDEKHLLLYEGYENYYFCDTDSMCCYCMPKDKRAIIRYDKNHKNSCCMVA